MTLDDLTRTALIRGATAFAVVLVVGSTAVYTSARLRGDSEGAASPSPVSPSPAQPPVTGTPEAWLAWVPGGLPDGFGASIFVSTKLTDAFEPQILWIQSFKDAGGMIRPRINWYAAKNTAFGFGVDIFTGPSDGYFGRYNNRDRAYAEVRVDF